MFADKKDFQIDLFHPSFTDDESGDNDATENESQEDEESVATEEGENAVCSDDEENN